MKTLQRRLMTGGAAAIFVAFGAGMAVGAKGDSNEPEEGPGYPTNQSGQSYGTYNEKVRSNDDMPELVGVIADDGQQGYVYKSDLFGDDEPATPEEALASSSQPRSLTVYKSDGKTSIGTFTIRAPLEDAPASDDK